MYSRRRGIRRPLAAIQAFAVTTLLMSTTIHWAVVVLQRFGSVLVNPGMDMGTFWGQFVAEQCVGTATLTINVRTFRILMPHAHLIEDVSLTTP